MFTYVGANLIAAEIRPDNPAAVAITAGREFLRRIIESIENQESLIVETTLSGKSFVKTIQRAKQAGYHNGVHGHQDVAQFDGRSFQVFDAVLFEFYMRLAELENDSKE